MKSLSQLKLLIGKHGQWLVFFSALIYFFLFCFISLWKYYNFGYNALDLAIINQVFYNTSLGNFFASSIHPLTYLGDHFSPIIFLLLPFYFLVQQPTTLLILQTIILTSCVWPIYLIAKSTLNKNWAVFFALAWLINPFVQNINLFEFSFLPIAIFLLLFTFYFYQTKNFIWFILFGFLSLLVREDVALVIFMFGLVALLEKKGIKWWLTCLMGSSLYFILALKITALFAPDQHYKFLIYYSWLGQTPLLILKNIILKPYLPLAHLFMIGNWEMVLGLLLPFIFLPLIAPFYLLLAAIIFGQMAFGASGGGQLILQTHYVSLFLPPVFIAAVYSIKKIYTTKTEDQKFILLIKKYQPLAFLLLITALIYSFFTLGPILGVTKYFYQNGFFSQKSLTKQKLISEIPAQAAVAAGYDFLTPLSSRNNLYSFNYVFLGKQQFLSKDYSLPINTQFLIFDYQDLISYQLQYGQSDFYQKQYEQGLKNWSKNLAGFGLIDLSGSLVLYQKGAENKFELLKILDQKPKLQIDQNVNLNQEINFFGFNKLDNQYQLFWQTTQSNKPYRIITILKRDDKIFSQQIYPWAYDQLISQDLNKKIIQTNYWFEFDQKIPAGIYNLKLKLLEIEKGGIEINEISGTKNVIDKQNFIGPEIDLGQITI
ncbi:MAG: DUF2079 domain-containing protein [Patescibacteria group bacterium]